MFPVRERKIFWVGALLVWLLTTMSSKCHDWKMFLTDSSGLRRRGELRIPMAWQKCVLFGSVPQAQSWDGRHTLLSGAEVA